MLESSFVFLFFVPRQKEALSNLKTVKAFVSFR